MSLTGFQNASHGSKKSCDVTVKSFFLYNIKKTKTEQAQNGCCKNGCRWDLCKVSSKGEVKEGRVMARAASQWISHSRPGLSVGGCAWGEITGLLPPWCLHRHTATDRKLLAPGCLTYSPQHCFSTIIFSVTHVLIYGAWPTCRPGVFIVSASLNTKAGYGLLCSVQKWIHTE